MATAIKIYDDIWITKRMLYDFDYKTRVVSNHREDDLAYMCQHGKDSAFKKRMETGIGWSRNELKPDGEVFKNEPLEGFKVGKSVSRYSTDNKVFRLEDPRGFTVEISSGNLEMIIRNGTIINGVIQGKCVWGREDKNILLSVDSDEYKNAFSASEKLISVNDLTPGDKVLMQNGHTYIYAGKAEVTFDVPVCLYEYREVQGYGSGNSRYVVQRHVPIKTPSLHYFLDEKDAYLYDYTVFERDYGNENKIKRYVTFTTPKISKIVSKGENFGKFDKDCWFENATQNIPGYNEDKLRAACGLCSSEEARRLSNEFDRTYNWRQTPRVRHNPEFVWDSGRKIKNISYK